ncbi:SMI1/KNR4 family protein [Streptomyces scopuliridis]|uniref:SMI1/KNR4 family protein n=1 Tax=Streptomyces scopuliridis TaxID=452529 RepID=UPI0036CA0F21
MLQAVGVAAADPKASAVLPPVLSEAQVRRAEEQFGVVFPDDYRQYLLHVSAGGRFARSGSISVAGAGTATSLRTVRTWMFRSRSTTPLSQRAKIFG